MINNERELKITRRWLKRFRQEAISLQTRDVPPAIDPKLIRTMIASAESMAHDLEMDIEDYEKHKASLHRRRQTPSS